MRISDWSSDVCSSDLQGGTRWRGVPIERSFHLGTFARYALVRAEAVTPRPADLAAERACILGCAVMTGIGSVINIAEVQAGDSVAVVGCGGVGLNVIQGARRSEEHTSELQSLMRISYAVFCLKKKTQN